MKAAIGAFTANKERKVQILTRSYVDSVPIGTIIDNAVPWVEPPDGYIKSYGQEVSRALYSDLLNYLCPTRIGNTTNANAVVTMTDTRALQTGMQVEGPGVTNGTTISSINPNVSITLSANATATATSVTLRFFIFGAGTYVGGISTTFNLPPGQKFFIGQDPNTTPFDKIGNTGGAATVSLTGAQLATHTHDMQNHTHTLGTHSHTTNIYDHQHSYTGSTGDGSNQQANFAAGAPGSPASKPTHTHTFTNTTDRISTNTTFTSSGPTGGSDPPNNNTTTGNSTGGAVGAAHENMPPYVVIPKLIKYKMLSANLIQINTTSYGAIRTVSSGTTATLSDETILVDPTAASLAIVIPDAATALGKLFVIKDGAGTCSPTRTITLTVATGDTIDGQTSWVLDSAREWVAIRSDGTNYYVVG